MQKLHPNPVIHYGLILLIFGVGALTLVSHTVLHAEHAGHHQAASCQTTGKTIQVTVQSKKIQPETIQAERCDKLVITNKDTENHEIALGAHEHHTAYPGFTEKVLQPGQSLSVTLSERGDFHIHDHLHPIIEADLNVR